MSLARRSVRSAGYTIAASGVQAVIQFVRLIMLARLLTPEQFGIYAYANAIVIVTRALPGFGMGAALIHRSSYSEDESIYRVHFTLSVLFNALWVLGLGLGSLWFLKPQTHLVFLSVLLATALFNLSGTPDAILRRKVDFRRTSLISIVNTLFGSAAALWLAWRGAGVWSLVATDIITALVTIGGFYLIRPVWKPQFGWKRETAGYLLDFGRRNVLSILLLQALDRVDDLWTGAVLGNTALGFYSRAYTFATYPRKLLATPINQVATSTYAALKGQPRRLSQAFFRVNAFLIRTGFLFAGLLFLLIPEFIHYVIGDKWLPMMFTFRLMLIYTLLDPIKITVGNVFLAMGEPEKIVQARAWQMVVLLVGLFILGPLWGINGVALAADIMLFFGLGSLLREVRVHVQFSLRALFGVPLLALGAGLGLTTALHLAMPDQTAAWLQAALKGSGFALVYLLVLLSLEYPTMKKMFSLGMAILHRQTSAEDSLPPTTNA